MTNASNFKGQRTRQKVDAFDQGKRAWGEQTPKNSNPFDPRTPEADAWDRGWEAGRDAALKG